MARAEPVNLEKEIRKRVAFNRLANNASNMLFNDFFFSKNGKMHDADSVFYDPYFVSDNAFDGIRTIYDYQGIRQMVQLFPVGVVTNLDTRFLHLNLHGVSRVDDLEFRTA